MSHIEEAELRGCHPKIPDKCPLLTIRPRNVKIKNGETTQWSLYGFIYKVWIELSNREIKKCSGCKEIVEYGSFLGPTSVSYEGCNNCFYKPKRSVFSFLRK